MITPGVSGSAGWLIALMLMLKGYSVRGMNGFDMPSNWHQIHSAFRAESVRAIMAYTQRRAQRSFSHILAG